VDLHQSLDEATGVLTLTMDDGSRNALGPDAFDAISAAFTGAGDDVRAIVIGGREGVLTAGLDVKFMASAGRDGVRDLLGRFGRTWMQVWTDPRPTVLAATGHCLAAGTMLSMACDHAVAAEGDWAWGLTETQIDFEMPDFGLALARANMRGDRLEDLLLPGRKVGPAEAVECGFADEVAPAEQVVARAQQVAAALAALPARAYRGTKLRLRQATAQSVLDGLDADVAALTAHLPD
jgi:enoyl-CoA hydratase